MHRAYLSVPLDAGWSGNCKEKDVCLSANEVYNSKTMARLLSFSFCLALSAAAWSQQNPSEQSVMRMAQAIRKEVLTLPNYGVFDWITFQINGYNVILKGYASRPRLKDDVERVVKKVEGVAAVDNRIQVLPLSPNDDRLRAGVYRAVYRNPSLSRYDPWRGTPRFFSPAMIAGGITNNPPIGNHPIHIIVNNGNVILEGVVDNEGDSAIANMQANQVNGVFSVDNSIHVINSTKKAK